jgi:hypothetical protein
MSWDESLFRAVNGLAGHVSVIDQFLLIVGYRGTFYIPLACAIIYWIWSNRREALLGGTLLGGVVGLVDLLSGQLKWVVERVRPCRALSNVVMVEPGGCGSVSPHALSAFRLGQLAGCRVNRVFQGLRRGPLRHGRAGRLGDRRIVQSRYRVGAFALLTCSLLRRMLKKSARIRRPLFGLFGLSGFLVERN